MKYLRWLLLAVFLMPILALAYDNLVPPPEDVGGFASWLMASAQGLKGLTANMIVAFVLTLVVGIFHLAPLKTWFDKLGKWKFIIPLLLGAGAEIAINWPNPFSWSGLLSMFMAGAFGTGATAIAFYHIFKGFKEVPTT